MVVPPLPPAVPRFGNAITRAVGRMALRAMGWRMEGAIPNLSQGVVVVAPHTSNVDLPIGIAFMLALGLRINWLGKHTIFWWPLRPVLVWLGGIPVDRQAATDVVSQVVLRFRSQPQMFLGMAPEGTRGRVARWKTGFHRIARGAGVPIVPVALDYSRRRVVVWPPVAPTADLEADLLALRSRYDPSMARHPEQFA